MMGVKGVGNRDSFFSFSSDNVSFGICKGIRECAERVIAIIIALIALVEFVVSIGVLCGVGVIAEAIFAVVVSGLVLVGSVIAVAKRLMVIK